MPTISVMPTIRHSRSVDRPGYSVCSVPTSPAAAVFVSSAISCGPLS